MKKLIIILLVSIATNLFAQSNFEEVIYLKNGSVINGIIIEEVPNLKIKIQTSDGNIFEYQMSEIEKFAKRIPAKTEYNKPYQTSPQVIIQTPKFSDSTNPKPVVVKQNYKDFLKEGFIGITEIGTLFAGDSYGRNYTYFSFNQVIGGRTSQHFSIGMGFGVDVNAEKYFRILKVPVTLDTRIYFIKKRFSPFLNIAPGYSFERINYKDSYFNVDSQIFHAFIANMGIGTEFKINKKIGVSFNIGGRLNVYPDLDNDTEINGNGFVKFGIIY